MDDLISRQAALKKLAVYIHLIDKTMGKGLLTDDDCMEAAKSVLGEDELPAVQPDHVADISKKVDMMHEYIYKIVQDCDGVSCYIKQGKIIRCKDCKHKHVENMVWTCPFGLPGGENFFCGYGTEPYKGE